MEDYYYESSASDPYGSSYTYTTTSLDSSDAAVAGFMAAMGIGFFIFMFILFIALYVYCGITMGKIFKKAGEPAWAAWVPFYNMWKMLEIGGFNGALVLLTLIPGVGPLVVTVLTCIAAYRIGLKFGKAGEFVLFYIFLAPVWLGILAFGKSQWNGGQDNSGTTTMQPPQPPIQPIEPPQQPTI